MIRLTRDVISRWLERLLHIHDSPQRTAAAFALGVFFGFSPLLGFHTVLALLCAFAFGLNRVAVLLGVYSNLPWIIAPYYVFATAAGVRLLGSDAPAQVWDTLTALFLHSPIEAQFWHMVGGLSPLLLPYTVGSTICALILSLVAYRASLAFLRARRDHFRAARDGAGLS